MVGLFVILISIGCFSNFFTVNMYFNKLLKLIFRTKEREWKGRKKKEDRVEGTERLPTGARGTRPASWLLQPITVHKLRGRSF